MQRQVGGEQENPLDSRGREKVDGTGSTIKVEELEVEVPSVKKRT